MPTTTLLLHDAAARRTLQRRLLAWFDAAARDLPWRRTRDPYAIWVSEVMLQQTQVATVIGYFDRFLTAFPTVQALAAAHEQAVLRLWEGLGYYRRGRALHEAARRLCAEHDGRIPTDAAALGALPGLGRYTVNAILSQAYEQRLPILEANSRRVLCRLLGVRDDPSGNRVQQQLWQAAAALLPRRRIGAFNQALMELGALVCTPRAPDCAACPLAGRCVAHRLGLQQEIPAAARAPRIEEVGEIAVALRRGPNILLVQRPNTGRWAGLWEFPRRPMAVGDAAADAAAEAAALVAALGFSATIGAEVTTIRHSVTRFRITVVCLEATYRAGRLRPGAYARGVWMPLADLAGYPCSSPQRRLAAALGRER